MTSGKPFSKREIAYIKQHLDEKYPSVIARHLGMHFADDNGGSRSTDAVAKVVAKITSPKTSKAKSPMPSLPDLSILHSSPPQN